MNTVLKDKAKGVPGNKGVQSNFIDRLLTKSGREDPEVKRIAKLAQIRMGLGPQGSYRLLAALGLFLSEVDWPKKSRVCASCGTDADELYGEGLCLMCYMAYQKKQMCSHCGRMVDELYSLPTCIGRVCEYCFRDHLIECRSCRVSREKWERVDYAYAHGKDK